ncbi:MAG: STAS domain-containing protein [Actinomycetota bacterium]|nr:STAS domain-containing protein [Actinomycetota bacterium]
MRKEPRVLPALQLTEDTLDAKTHVITLSGELDVATVPVFDDALRAAIESGHTALVVDLIELTFMDSTGLMVLLNGLRRVMRKDGRLVLACANPTVLRLFDITGTSATFTIVETREQAIEAARS